MVWVKYKEKFHGQSYIFWKYHKNLEAAKKTVTSWNRFGNKSEHLQILRHRETKPDNLRKGEAKGIYLETQATKKKRKTTTKKKESWEFPNVPMF